MPHLGRMTVFYLVMLAVMIGVVVGILWLIQRYLGVEISWGSGVAAPMIAAMLSGQMFHRWEGRRPRMGEGFFFALLFTALSLLVSLCVIWFIAWEVIVGPEMSDPVFWGALGIVTFLTFLITWFFIHFGARQDEKYGGR